MSGAECTAAQLVRQRGRQIAAPLDEAAEHLTLLLQRGLPWTSEAIGYADRLCDRLGRVPGRIEERWRSRVARVEQRLDAALPFFRPGGLFSVFSGLAPGTDPLTIIGPSPPV